MLLKLVGMHWRAVLSRRFMQLYLDGAVMYRCDDTRARSTQPATRPKAPARVRIPLRARRPTPTATRRPPPQQMRLYDSSTTPTSA